MQKADAIACVEPVAEAAPCLCGPAITTARSTFCIAWLPSQLPKPSNTNRALSRGRLRVSKLTDGRAIFSTEDAELDADRLASRICREYQVIKLNSCGSG